MDRKVISSSMIRSIGHEAHSSILEIEFNDGAIWQYFDFSESSWHDFDSSESQGKYFHANIKGKYREGKVG